MKLSPVLFLLSADFIFCIICIFLLSLVCSLCPASITLITLLLSLGLWANWSLLKPILFITLAFSPPFFLNYLLNTFESNFNYFTELQDNFSTIPELVTSITCSYFTSLYCYATNTLKIVVLIFSPTVFSCIFLSGCIYLQNKFFFINSLFSTFKQLLIFWMRF